jgi:hypothetical protein
VEALHRLQSDSRQRGLFVQESAGNERQSFGAGAERSRRQDFIEITFRLAVLPAGYTLLDRLRNRGDNTPFFFYAVEGDEHEREAHENHAQGSTEDYRKLFQMVMPVLSVIR